MMSGCDGLSFGRVSMSGMWITDRIKKTWGKVWIWPNGHPNKIYPAGCCHGLVPGKPLNREDTVDEPSVVAGLPCIHPSPGYWMDKQYDSWQDLSWLLNRRKQTWHSNSPGSHTGSIVPITPSSSHHSTWATERERERLLNGQTIWLLTRFVMTP